MAVICGLTGTITFLAMMLAQQHILAEIIVGTFLLKASFALYELGRAAFRVADLWRKTIFPRARAGSAFAVQPGPDRTCRSKELLAGTVESLAENASDSFVAPLFYYLLLGVPGAMVYRAINTMDAMIGYRGQYEALGKAAARLDDVANWVPARTDGRVAAAGRRLAVAAGGRLADPAAAMAARPPAPTPANPWRP